MNKGKVSAIIVAIILIIAAIFLVIKIKNNSHTFKYLIVNYKNDKQEYKDIKVDNVFVVNNISFWIVSTNKDTIVLNSSDYLFTKDENKVNEFQIELNKDTHICFTSSDCVHMHLE